MSLYQQLGLEPIINVSGSVTRLGGAPLPESVVRAFCEAAGETVPLDQLQAAASQRLAEITGTQAGLVTAGSAAALTLGAAAILCRDNLSHMERLPDCDGFPHEFVMAREQRSGYDHAVRLSGATLREVGFNEMVSNAGVRRTETWEYEAAFGPETAGVLYVHAPDSRPSLAEVVECAHRHQLPVLVDAAGELPPRNNLSAIPATRADLVCFSGGKAIRGPQSTGILCGQKELIASAAVQMLDMDDHPELWDPPADLIDRSRFAGMPRHGIGRPMKVSREEIVALLAALDLFVSGEYDAQNELYRGYLRQIIQGIRSCPVTCTLIDPADSETLPRLEIALDETTPGRTAFDVCRSLRNGSPPIYVGHSRLPEGCLIINPLWLNEARTDMLIRSLREVL